ncbi:molybdenum cofactor guanylyltransferase [Halobacillus locisalis]|uniref:Molybdenum cofactor guanylyltransferase n=2 Tax=Halobacillus locisalis TaxID=220753 RepID=A0A838CQM8_9BACI|nr:molybdenum cofactor guanylyltransferase [Halobacillus locisalis]
MGEDKASLMLGGQTVLNRIAQELRQVTPSMIVNSNETRKGYEVKGDLFQDAGPLGGLHAGMYEESADWFIVSACDTPFIQKAVYHYLLEQRTEAPQAIIPVYQGRHQPLSGIYHKSVFEPLGSLLSEGERKMTRLFGDISVMYVDTFTGLSSTLLERHFFNMNTPEEYRQAEKMVKTF